MPIVGIGRECGSDNLSPLCSLRRRKPASRRAAVEKGGVLTSPWSHTSGLFTEFIGLVYVGYDIFGSAA